MKSIVRFEETCRAMKHLFDRENTSYRIATRCLAVRSVVIHFGA